MKIWALDLRVMVMLQSNVFSMNGTRSIGYHKKDMTHNSYCTQKISSMCIVDLNMKFKTTNPLENSIEEHLHDLTVSEGKDFMVGTLLHQISKSLTTKKGNMQAHG